jgi:hypothetical protein
MFIHFYCLYYYITDPWFHCGSCAIRTWILFCHYAHFCSVDCTKSKSNGDCAQRSTCLLREFQAQLARYLSQWWISWNKYGVFGENQKVGHVLLQSSPKVGVPDHKKFKNHTTMDVWTTLYKWTLSEHMWQLQKNSGQRRKLQSWMLIKM